MNLLNAGALLGADRYLSVSADVFASAFASAKLERPIIAESCSDFAATDGDAYYLSADGLSGYTVRRTGELVYVWSLAARRGDRLVADAINNGARHLDCFDGYLPTLYGRHGFAEVAREANWNADGPDVVWMAR
jgi:hypothetical protein